MDFRSLIGKLEKIEQKQLLQESAVAAEQVLSKELELLKESYINLMERLTYKINQAAAKIDNEEERKKFLGKAAANNGYPGLFDPVTGKFVDATGQYAWFGAYKSEVEQMERDGLIPQAARTEALLGMMGKDKDTAFGNSEKVATKDQMVDTAEDIMAKGRQSWDPTASGAIKESKRGTLAQSITESFGYSFKQLVESITRDEHKQLKDIVVKLKDYEGDADATRVLKAYDEYVRIRTIIIGKIDAILKELATLRGTVLKESREMLREEIYVFGDEETNEYGALKLYYDANNNLVEYSLKDFGQDTADMGRGAAKSVSFGYSDNAVAGIKALFKGTKYADELKKELEATEEAWNRSPYLYGAGYAAGMLPYALTGPVGVGLGAAGFVSDVAGVRDKHNLNTLMNREKEIAANGGKDPKTAVQTSQKVQPATKIQYSPEVEKLQQLILKKDPNALPVHGVDGKMGPETITAAKRLGIALPASTPAAASAAPATPQVDPAVAQQLMTALGAKDPTSAVTAFDAKVKAAGGDTSKVIAQLIGLEAVVKESITFSSMTESERMSYLLNKMTVLEGIEALGRPIIGMLELAAGKGTAAVMAALAKAIPNIASKGVVIAGETWAPIAGQVGKFSNGKGAVMEAEQILHIITNTSTVGDTVLVAGKTYQKTASGWTEAGKAKVLAKSEQAGIESQWAKTNGKDPRAPAPKADPAAPKADPAAPKVDPAAVAANDAVIPTNKIAQWVETKYPRLTGAYRKIVAGGKVPAKYLSSNKWWAALAALIAWGYIWPGITDADTTSTTANPSTPNSDQKVDPAADEANKRKEQELTAQLGSLTKMLQDMFPDDQEALDAITRAGGSGEVQSDQKAVPNPRAYNTDFQPTTTSRFDK